MSVYCLQLYLIYAILLKRAVTSTKGAKKMKFNTIYKKGNVDYFFIRLDNKSEWAFIQPYFIFTTREKCGKGRIKKMGNLFSGDVFFGQQLHDYGYSASADVYGTLIHNIILKEYAEQLSEIAKKELRAINTCNDELNLSNATLHELSELNKRAILNKLN